MNCACLSLILISALQLQAAAGYSQKVRVKYENRTVAEVMNNIKRQTGYNFAFVEKSLVGQKRITVKDSTMELADALRLIESDQPFKFEIVGKTILVLHKKDSDATTPSSSFLGFDLGGRVLDEDGLPVARATVAVKETRRSTMTSENGTFNVAGVTPGQTLVVTCIGFEDTEIRISDPQLITVKLKKSSNPLNVVQVIGYGVTSQRQSTGTVSKLTAKSLSNQPVANVLSAMQGQMPGIMLQSMSGNPGAEVKMQVNGINSISGGNNLLIIVDGIPQPTASLNSTASVLNTLPIATGPLSPLNSVNPQDVESIELLRGADATSIYGSRGANGVLLITTKRGKPGRTKLEANYYRGIEQPTVLMKTISGPQYLALAKEAYQNDGVALTPDKAPELTTWDQNRDINWPKEILGNTASLSNLSVNLSGGNNNTNYLSSLTYRNEETITVGDFGYKRWNYFLNVNTATDNRRLQSSFSVQLSSDNNRTTVNDLGNIFYTPNYNPLDSAGKLNWPVPVNYLGLIMQTAQTKTTSVNTSGKLQYELLNGLLLKLSVGYNRQAINATSVTPKKSTSPSLNITSSAAYGHNEITSYIAEPMVEYSRQWQKSFKTTVLAGATYQYTLGEGYHIRGENYSSDELLYDLASAGSFSTLFAPKTIFSEYKYLSGFARINLNYEGKYIINASYRRDGSSRFGPENRFGSFASIAGAWIFSEENLIKRNLKPLSFGKIRFSYGTVGNDQITDYQYLATYRAAATNNTYQGVGVLVPSRLANPDYKWEVNKKMELGLELGFLKDRVLLNATAYKNTSANQLVGYPLPAQTGFTSFQYNLPAIVENKGVDLSLTTTPVRAKDFEWNLSANVSFVSNKLKSFPGLSKTTLADLYAEGEPLTIQKGYAFQRIDENTGLPVFRRGSGKDTLYPQFTGDRFIMGSTMPTLFGGFTNNLKYKTLELSFTFQFVKQDGLMPYFWPGSNSYLGSYQPPEVLNRWSPTNKNGTEPIASTLVYNANANKSYNIYRFSDRFFGDASYMRLKNVSLSYMLPRNTIKNFKGDIRVFANGQNLLTFTDYLGSDPETPNNLPRTPNVKIITAGLSVSL